MISARAAAFAKKNWGLLALLLMALVVSLWFASRLFMDFLYFNDPQNVDVELKPWMTPRFIVLTYDVPRALVFEILDLEEGADRGIRLGRWARDRDMSMAELTERVRSEVADYRAQTND